MTDQNQLQRQSHLSKKERSHQVSERVMSERLQTTDCAGMRLSIGYERTLRRSAHDSAIVVLISDARVRLGLGFWNREETG